MRATRTDIFYIVLGAIFVTVVSLLLMAYEADASTTEREGIDAIAAELVDVSVMEELAATIADPEVTPACKGYADLLLLYAAYLRHMLAFPESRVAVSEFANRVALSIPSSQYACENAL